MSRFISASITGVSPTDGGYIPPLIVYGKAVCMLQFSNYGNCDQSRIFKSLSLPCISKKTRFMCSATSSYQKKNTHFSRQNKHGFSRNRNKRSEDRDSREIFEESELFSKKDGAFLTSTGSSKFQTTATPGAREKEIVELFRKVQAQLRERASMKEERKTDESQKKSKATETVDSLLKLLKKHSGQQEKTSTWNDSYRDFMMDQREQNGRVPAERKTSTFGSSSSMKQDHHYNEAPVTSRPRSNFQRRSPVPQIDVYSDEDITNSVSRTNFDRKENWKTIDPKLEVEPDFEPTFSDNDVFVDMSDSEDETSEIQEDDDVNVSGRGDGRPGDLSEMKLVELRAVAKSRGLKGFSKLKKHELLQLLDET